MSIQPEKQPHPLRSVYTSNFPAILNQLGVSLVISTYQAGKLIIARADGDSLNTHFIGFNKPMGVALNPKTGEMAVGGAHTIWRYQNLPALARKLDSEETPPPPPPGEKYPPPVPPEIQRYDAVFVPRQVHVSGDVDIHEMAYASDGQLWYLNTKFGSLCTLEGNSSFVPRWNPPFLSALQPEDRCHLNGLCMENGAPRFVTMLGQTDTPGGWRANKRSGGLLMDLTNNQVLLEGLSMPHSPRLYNGKFWILESGQGSLAQVDLNSRSWQTVTQLPGFTRGMDFAGPLAFIGLSQVRESAVFSGIPLVERLQERICGVWVVNIQTGEILAFLRFEEGVQEIFAVQVVPARFPALLDMDHPRVHDSYSLPDEAMHLVRGKQA